MSLYRIRFTGRKIGAIGIFYHLPSVLVFGADDSTRAAERAREHLSKKYEHLGLSEVVKLEQPRNTLRETPAAKRGTP